MKFTVGTHNLHDYTGTPTLFADVIVFTEAIPARIRRAIKGTRYRMVVCRAQPDLAVVYDSRVFRRDTYANGHAKPARYTKYVDGRERVSPHRGTFTVSLVHRATGRKVKVNAEHRINAAFAPYIRGEADFRRNAWQRHTYGTLRTMEHQEHNGALVVSAGDVNTPRGQRGYPGFHEIGEHFDRIGSTAELSDLDVLSRMGSDHPRIRATVTERKP